MKKTLFVVLATLLLVPLLAQAQQPQKIFRIGYFSGTDRATDAPRADGVRQALREIGYVEGQNLIIEFRHAEQKRERQAAFAAELVRLKVDAIVVAGGYSNIRVVVNATKTIPIVLMGQGADPVREGYVKSLARPGGNVTGFTNFSTVLSGKRLELLKEAAPKVTSVAVLYNPAGRSSVIEVNEELPDAARALGLSLRFWEARDANDLEKALLGFGKSRPDGLYLPGGVVRYGIKRVVNFALQQRWPAIYGDRHAIEFGGLMSYTADETEQYKRVAYFVDRILKGTKPADLPVEQPTKFEFVVNLKTANQIGLTIPQWTLMKADRVIR